MWSFFSEIINFWDIYEIKYLFNLLIFYNFIMYQKYNSMKIGNFMHNLISIDDILRIEINNYMGFSTSKKTY